MASLRRCSTWRRSEQRSITRELAGLEVIGVPGQRLHELEVFEFESWADVAAHEGIIAAAACGLPLAGADDADGFVFMCEHDGFARACGGVVHEQLQWRACVEMPDFVGPNDVPA